MLTAADIHNAGPIVGSSRPALKNNVPFTALLRRRFDIRNLGAALGCSAWVKVPGSKPSDLSRNARLGIFLGMAIDTIGWRILILEDRSEIVPHHALIDHDISNRPALLAQHDRLLLLDSPLSTGPTLFNRAIRDLMTAPATTHSPRGFIMYSPVTHQPITYVLTYDADQNPDLVELNATPLVAPDPPRLNGPRTSARPPRRPHALRSSGPPKTLDDTLPVRSPAPSLPLTPSARQRLRLIVAHRPNTPIRIAVENPKRPNSKSALRYDTTKHTRSVAEYFAAGGKMADFLNDYTRSYIDMGALASLQCLDPTLLLFFLGAPNMGAISPGPTDFTTPHPAIVQPRLEPPESLIYSLYTIACGPCLPTTPLAASLTPAAHLHPALIVPLPIAPLDPPKRTAGVALTPSPLSW